MPPKRETGFSDVLRFRYGRCPCLFIYPCFGKSLRTPIRLFETSIGCIHSIAQRMYKVLIAYPLSNLTFRDPAILYRGRKQGDVVVPITEIQFHLLTIPRRMYGYTLSGCDQLLQPFGVGMNLNAESDFRTFLRSSGKLNTLPNIPLMKPFKRSGI